MAISKFFYLVFLILNLSISFFNKVDAKTKLIVKVAFQPNDFNGSFSTNLDGKLISISLLTKINAVSGTFIMNGEQATVTGLIKNGTCSGKIVENNSGKTYSFTADRKDNKLNFSITFPEQNNQVVKLILTKDSNLASTSKNSMLIGTWRNTEVISSGSGALYSSIATDYFAKFNADGTVLIWTGKSAGGTSTATIDGSASKNVSRMQWYTAGKILYLINPGSKEKTAISYYAEANRIMLTSGKNKKVYQRVKDGG